MGPLSYMRSVVERNVVMRRIPIFTRCKLSRMTRTACLDRIYVTANLSDAKIGVETVFARLPIT
jgi:hypothetical protein